MHCRIAGDSLRWQFRDYAGACLYSTNTNLEFLVLPVCSQGFVLFFVFWVFLLLRFAVIIYCFYPSLCIVKIG